MPRATGKDWCTGASVPATHSNYMGVGMEVKADRVRRT